MRHLLMLPLAVFLLGATPAPRPKRIVSLNLCADQYLLALADRSQIVALTRFARDPEMSAAAEQAIGIPITQGSAEEVLLLRPDLVIGSPGRRSDAMAALKARKIPKLDVKLAKSYADIVEQVRAVAVAVGHPERGEALIAAMDRSLAGIATNAGHGATAAYYQRRGFLTGTGTLVDDLMKRVGLHNLAAQLKKPAIAYISIEEMALARPDYLIVETSTNRVVDQGTEMLHHPLLANIRRLALPQAWTVCGGPAYARAARNLADQLRDTLPTR